MNTTASEVERAKPISWVTTTMVMPSAPKSAISARMPLTISGSSAEVASSKNITCGAIARARAIATRCCCPPDNMSGRALALCFRPTRSSWSNASIRASSLDSPRSLRGASVTLSTTLRCGNRLKCWNTMPMRCRRSLGLSRNTDRPSSRMSPLSGSCRRFKVRSSVDLPDPDGPITAAVVPAGTSKSTPRSTTLPPSVW
ncbi:Amino acid ABC transporter, ATP-binding protein [Mycobacterium marinum MB2]|nr:Amino acid ABC transporter, ATP-binding protein [Mycobacterium marinum MB2]